MEFWIVAIGAALLSAVLSITGAIFIFRVSLESRLKTLEKDIELIKKECDGNNSKVNKLSQIEKNLEIIKKDLFEHQKNLEKMENVKIEARLIHIEHEINFFDPLKGILQSIGKKNVINFISGDKE